MGTHYPRVALNFSLHGTVDIQTYRDWKLARDVINRPTFCIGWQML